MTTPEISVTIEELGPIITVSTEGLQGPIGPEGPSGAAGGHYTHTQTTPSTFWPISHNLGFQPNVAVIVGGVDVSDGVVVAHIDDNNASVTANAAISGKAECS